MLSREKKLERIQRFYDDRIRGWMIPDLKKGIKAKANFLTALGCFVYTEAVGHLLPSLGKNERGKQEERHFYRCLFRFDSQEHLINLDKSIRDTGGVSGIYGIRHAMVHRYYPTQRKRLDNGDFLFLHSTVALDGVIVDQVDNTKIDSPPIFIDNNRNIAIALNNYIKEFEKCVDESYIKTFISKESNYIEAALSKHNEILGSPIL